jgi:hypothetical protein
MCKVDRIITYDETVTPPDLAAQIDRHNGIWICNCENDCPKPAGPPA